MEKIIELQEGLSINTTVTVILFDKITLLYKRYEREDIGELEYTIEMIKRMKTSDSDWKILDDILSGEFDPETMEKLDKWGEIIQKIVLDFVEAKKKQKKLSENTKGQ